MTLLTTKEINMKIGIFCTPDDIDFIKDAKTAGADFLEVPLASFESMSDEAVLNFKKTLDEIGIGIFSFNVMLPGNRLRVVEEVASDEEITKYLDKVLSLTDLFGAKYIIFGSGGARKRHKDEDISISRRKITHYIKDLALPMVKAHGRSVLVEALNENEDNTVYTVKEALGYVDSIDDASLGAIIDFYHTSVMNENTEIYAGDKRIRHTHISGPGMPRSMPTEENGSKEFYESAARVIAKTSHVDTLTVEINVSMWGDEGTRIGNLASSIAFLKNLIDSKKYEN